MNEASNPSGAGLIESFLMPLVGGLRRADIPVSTSEVVDAAQALGRTGIADDRVIEITLRATLVKRQEDIEVLDSLLAAGRRDDAGSAPDAAADQTIVNRDGVDAGRDAGPDLLRRLAEALERGDEESLRTLAAEAVREFGDLGSATGQSERSHVYRVMRRLDLTALLQRAMRAALRSVEDQLERTLLVDELTEQIEDLRRRIAAEVHQAYGVGAPNRAARSPEQVALEDVPVLGASRDEVARMRETIRPLARRLAARARRRRERLRSGRLDVRRTMRASMSSGGVPLHPSFRRLRHSRPELVVLCDLSGSMAEFAHFMLTFITAISEELSGVRIFVFVDGVDEVTETVIRSGGTLQASHLLARTNVVAGDGHSDYGRALTAFVSRWPEVVTSRSTVLVAGDARTNHRSDGRATLSEVASRARALRWFNPEPAASWGSGDSAMGHYRQICDSAHQVCTLRQLEHAVESLLSGRATTSGPRR